MAVPNKKTCPKCQGSMSEGFIPGWSDGGAKASSWVEGQPDKRWWGLKLRGKAQFSVQSYRCSRCGFLENYAAG
jgi:rubredoxin